MGEGREGRVGTRWEQGTEGEDHTDKLREIALKYLSHHTGDALHLVLLIAVGGWCVPTLPLIRFNDITNIQYRMNCLFQFNYR